MSPTPLAAEPTEQLGDRVNLRAVLRAATADLHAHIDRAMPLARPAPTLADYLAHLLLLRDWLGALGQAMSGLNGLADEQAAVLADAEQAATLIGQPCRCCATRLAPSRRRCARWTTAHTPTRRNWACVTSSKAHTWAARCCAAAGASG